MSDLMSVSPQRVPERPCAGAAGAPDLPGLRATSVWSDAMVRAEGLRIEDAPFLSIGGGPASFAVIDFLRVCRVPVADIRVVSPQRRAYEQLDHLMRMSQIRFWDPLRSDSMSRMDNVWGFPSYALEQALRRRRIAPLLRVLTEPVVGEFFNPTPEQVFGGLDREAARIGWDTMLLQGRVEMVRRRAGGGYLSLVTSADDAPCFVLRSTYVHLGTGYPAVRYTAGIGEYRTRHCDYASVVNAYESHEHLYEILKRRRATVVVRGSGITASRVLQRLFEDREYSGQAVKIFHLFRNYADRGSGPLHFRRPGGRGWNYQAFSFPKAAGSGQLRRRMLRVDPQKRAEYVRSMTAATTAKRRYWQRQLRRARAEGYYWAVRGDVRSMEPDQGRIRLVVDVPGRPVEMTMHADFVIDCTGFEVNLRGNALLADVLDHAGARLNELKGLDVGPRFEVRGTAQESGQIYASGVIARGGYLAPVDSFWGFFHAAQIISDDLMRRGFCPRFGLTRSVLGWLKWLANRQP